MRLGRTASYGILIAAGLVLASVGAWLAVRFFTGSTQQGQLNQEAPGQSVASREATTAPVSGQPTARRAIETMLKPCLGRPVREVVQILKLQDAGHDWTHEPPCILRGARYVTTDRSITLYIAEGEPLFRCFSDRLDWDYKAFLDCRVGGIQYEVGELHLDLGPAVPVLWRR